MEIVQEKWNEVEDGCRVVFSGSLKAACARHGGENKVTQYSLAVGRLGPRGACSLSLCPTVPYWLFAFRHDLVMSAGLTRDTLPGPGALSLVCLAITA